MLKKVWNKLYNCGCTIKKDPKTDKEYLVLRGDHRNKIVEFLIEEGIGTKENIVKHGGDMWHIIEFLINYIYNYNFILN